MLGYALALALTGLGAVAQITLVGDATSRAPFLLFYPFIALTAFLAGVGPGFVMIACTGLFDTLMLHLRPGPTNWAWLAILSPLLVVGFAWLRDTRERGDAMRREYERFKFIGDHASDWILLLRSDGRIHYANHMACSSLGWPEDELIGRPVETLVPDGQRPALNDLLNRARAGTAAPTELTFLRRDGSTVLVELGCTGVETEEDHVIHAAARDVTERRQIEQKLREARLRESLGAMSGGLAHEFNNLLTAVMGNAALAKETLPPDHAARSMLESVITSGERCAELVRLMLASSGYRARRNEAVDLNEVMERLLRTRPLAPGVRVISAVRVAPLSGDRRSFETLLWSLITNGAESYDGAPGVVRVLIDPAFSPKPVPADFEEGELAPGPAIGITIEDSGCGMAPEVLARAFDPFFSTKFTGRGLGLPAVRGIVRSYGGTVRLSTAPGKGTRVEIGLPLDVAPREEPAAAKLA